MVDITGGTTSCMFKTYKREKQRLNKKNRPADHVAKFIPSNLYRDREFALQAIRWNAEVWAELPSAGRGSGPPVPPAVRRAPKDITLYGGASGGSTFCAPGDCKRQACKVEVDANPHPLTVQVWCMVDNVGGQRWCIFHTYKRENQRHDARLRIAEAKAVAGAGSGQGRAHNKAEGVKAVEHVVLETLRPRQDRGQPHVPKPGTHYRLHQL